MSPSISVLSRKSALSINAMTKSECIVVGVFEDQELSGASLEADTASGNLIARVVASGDMSGKLGKTMYLHDAFGPGTSRLILVGLGKHDGFDSKAFGTAVRAAWKALLATAATQVTFALPLESVSSRNADWCVRVAVLALRDETYRFDKMKSKPEPTKRHLEHIKFAVDSSFERSAKITVAQAIALADGIDMTRDLGNLPASICTPSYLAKFAKQLAKDWEMKVEVHGPKAIEALKMNSFLSVARGSIESPQFIVLQYQGTEEKAAPIVLVGKGVTFDSGGISIKPGEAMDEMRYDMSGAGAVLGTLRAVAQMGLKINVVGIIPACENMPSGNAVKPGDVVTSMKGLTIEVLNTDAEGRLILCDALTYAERFKPAAVIDIATLTGACMIALGHHRSGLFSKDDLLARELLDASQEACDPAWRLPLDDEYQEQLKSNFADLANIGGRPAGSVTAACFLSRFTEEYPWAHLDIAGTAWKSGPLKGATGRPVALLTQFLAGRAAG
jgi:leucyl aminopeptidase